MADVGVEGNGVAGRLVDAEGKGILRVADVCGGWLVGVLAEGWEAFYSREVGSDMWFPIEEGAIECLVQGPSHH